MSIASSIFFNANITYSLFDQLLCYFCFSWCPRSENLAGKRPGDDFKLANGKKPKNVGSRLAIILIIKKWESTKNPPPIGGGGGFERNLCYILGYY